MLFNKNSMLLAILLIFLVYVYKNNSLIKIKLPIKSKEISKFISTKSRNAKKSKFILLNENSKIIKINNTKDQIHPMAFQSNSNKEINYYLLNKFNSQNINYSVGKKIEFNFLNSIYNDLKFFFKYFVMGYVYLIILLNIFNISEIISNSLLNSTTNLNSINPTINLFESTNTKFKMFNSNNISLKEWVGSPEIFEECYELISYQINNSKYKKMGAILPKGILIEGPPGVGKTYLAKAIASETNSNFIAVSGSEFIEMYVGVGASRVRDLFKFARTNSPSIVFIDEIDALGSKRSDGNLHREHDQTLNQLLTEMDGFNDNSNVLIMAATNRKDILDPALLRPGRFDRHIHISLPDKYSREQILQLYLRKKKFTNINISIVAELTDGFSGADLKNLINEAAILTVRRGGKKIKLTDLTNAMERLVVGLVKSHDDRSLEAKYRVGIHEVGHGFLTIYFNRYFDLKKISIKSTYNGAGGYTLLTDNTEYTSSGLYTKDLLFKKIIVLLGGKAAESIWYGNEQISQGATQDLKQANQLARKMIELFGMGTNELETFYNTEQIYGLSYSEKTKELVDKQVMFIVFKAYEEAKSILKRYKLECDEIVEKLIIKEILYANDLNSYYMINFNEI